MTGSALIVRIVEFDIGNALVDFSFDLVQGFHQFDDFVR